LGFKLADAFKILDEEVLSTVAFSGNAGRFLPGLGHLCFGLDYLLFESLDVIEQRSLTHLGAVPRSAELGEGCDGAKFRIFDGLLDGAFRGGVAGFRAQVAHGNLEAVEELTGALGVDLAGGDALQHLADGMLDGGAVLGFREPEVAGFLLVGVARWDRLAVGVVVVAEGLWPFRPAQGG
jgi:hypothetical protein